MIRLTFVGDIVLDKPLLKAAKARGKGEFDFSDVFHTEEVFSKSDFVIGNMETCFGGGKNFNKKPYHYNSPDVFCQAVKAAGIELVSTANNHCMDEGLIGLQRTNHILDKSGILHTGTFCGEDQEKRFFVKTINGLKIAFYSLTYSVNVSMESLACENLYQYVNLIGFNGKQAPWLKQYYHCVVKPKIRQITRKIKKHSTISAHQDIYSEKKINKTWMSDVERQITRAKEESDLLIVSVVISAAI